MRNQEAARYARWAAIAAGVVALVVVGFYLVRAIRAARRQKAPAQVSASVQQQMQTFSYSGLEGNRTVFTIRASRATEYKAGSPAVLEDVWISIYGPEGDRNDSIHTRECSYEQKTGGVRCAGQVTIDVRGAHRQPGARKGDALHITTSNLTFDAQTGQAESPAAVEFSLPQGQGRGVGVSYRTRAAVVRIDHAVQFQMAPSPRLGRIPVRIEASSLEVRRNDRKVLLAGPVLVEQGGRQLSAGSVTVSLGKKFHARRLVATGHPSLRVSRDGDVLRGSATMLEADLTAAGWVEHVTASGNVSGTRSSRKGRSRFSSGRVDFAMAPTRNVLREMTASGSVVAQSQQAGRSETLRAPALRLDFAAAKQPSRQHIEQAETLGSSRIVLQDAREATELRAPKFTAEFTPAGRWSRLAGTTGVEVRRMPRTAANSAPQISTARALAASFARDGQWSVVEESGGVRFHQGDRRAFAQRARIDRTSGQILLTGSPVIEDSSSRTISDTVTLDQKSGAFAATGNVVTTYFPARRGNSSAPASQALHISAEQLSGSSSSGRVTYSGNARLWQGQAVLEAYRITLSRDPQSLEASGHATAAFAQAPGATLLPVFSEPKKSGPVLWKVYAPELTYSGAKREVRLAGGVRLLSGSVSLAARTVDLDLAASQPAEAGLSQLARGQLSQAVALGGVVVRQGGLQATADRAVYTARDGKFVLSGGNPTITDASGNSASGRSLTFFVPDDTILIDSQEGSRTLTRHRVEK